MALVSRFLISSDSDSAAELDEVGWDEVAMLGMVTVELVTSEAGLLVTITELVLLTRHPTDVVTTVTGAGEAGWVTTLLLVLGPCKQI